MKNAVKLLGLVGLLGGLGAAITALLYFGIPVSVGRWHVIAGAGLHGAILAVIAVSFSLWLWRRKPILRWLCLPAVGWVAGWLSSIPLDLSLCCDYSSKDLLRAFLWPFESGFLSWPDRITAAVLAPYVVFGLVAAVYFLLLAVLRQFPANSLLVHVLMGSLGGTLGSLWFWIGLGPWYFSLLHGTIWGSLVGFGVWRSQRWLRLGNDLADR